VPASPDRWVPPVSEGPRPRSLHISLPFPGGAGLSASISSRTRPLPPLLGGFALSALAARLYIHWQADPTCQPPSLTTRSRTPPWTRPCRAFFGRSPHAPDFFLEPALTRSLPSLSSVPQPTPSHLSLAPSAQLWSTAVVRRPFRGRRRVPVASIALVIFASSPATRDTLWFSPAPLFPLVRSPDFSPCSRVSATVHQGPRGVLAIAQVL
jgi:hypothetical protein